MAKSEECLIGGTDALSSGKAHSILFQQDGAPIFGGGRIPASQKRQVNKHLQSELPRCRSAAAIKPVC
jgi:hypothetical protein